MIANAESKYFSHQRTTREYQKKWWGVTYLSLVGDKHFDIDISYSEFIAHKTRRNMAPLWEQESAYLEN